VSGARRPPRGGTPWRLRLPQDTTDKPAPRPPGRPPRGGTPRRFRVVMTDSEHESLKARAVAEGCSVADLIRRIAPVSPER